MSPVPLKKQSIAGTSILKRRGERSTRAVEPTTEMVGEDGSKRTEVTMMWAMWWALWSLEIAAARVGREVILVPERSLGVPGVSLLLVLVDGSGGRTRLRIGWVGSGRRRAGGSCRLGRHPR